METMIEFAELIVLKHFKIVIMGVGIVRGLKLYGGFDHDNAILFLEGGKIKSVYIEEDKKIFVDESL
jgi:hypothetical protein